MIHNLIGFSYLGDSVKLEGENLVELLYSFWNYEMEVYDMKNNDLIFAPLQSNEFNNEFLNKFDLELIDGEKYREFRNVKTGEIYKSDF